MLLLLEALVALLAAAVCAGWICFELRVGGAPAPQDAPKHVLCCGSCRSKFPVFREIEQKASSWPLTNMSYVCATAGSTHHHLVYWDSPDDAADVDDGCWEIVCGACRRCAVLPPRLQQGLRPPGFPDVEGFQCLAGVPPFHRFA